MRLLLIDATGYLFRAFHALPPLNNAEGMPTGAVFGLVKMLINLRERWAAEKIAVVMDAPGKTFRHELSADYKANRPPLDESLRAQIDPAKQFVQAMGWPLICHSGVEADDVIATLAVAGRQARMEVIIASSDKDLMQFVDDKTILHDGMHNKQYNINAVVDKFGVLPRQMEDFLALVGDSADNIRGVNKVGAKTAAKWLKEYESLDKLIESANDIDGKVGENLRDAIKSGGLDLARRLVAVKTDVSLDSSVDNLSPMDAHIKEWRTLCDQYEFRQLAKIFNKQEATASIRQHEIIRDVKQLQEWIKDAKRQKLVAVDTETDGVAVMQTQIVGFSLAAQSCAAIYVPLAHNHIECGAQIASESALAQLQKLLEDNTITKIFHNGKYDLHVLANYGLTVNGVIEDTKIAAALMSPNKPNSLSALAKDYLNAQTINYRDVVDGKNVKNFSQVDVESAAAYAAEDAQITYQLYNPIIKKLSSVERKIYETIDRPLMPVLYAIERAGVKIDDKALKKLSEELLTRMAQLTKEAYDIAEGNFNLNSPRQLETLLFDKMGASPLRKTAGGKARSTDEQTLSKLADDYPLARVVLAHRHLAKLVNTYAEKLPRQINPRTGRVHTDFNQTFVITGRLASSNPNLQNIPIRTETGRRIRRAFIAADNCVLISADYSQIELRIMAHFANDDNLLSAFADGADIHRRTAAEVFNTLESSIDNNQRRAAKAINFGLIYGMSEFGLSQNLGVSRQQAKEYINLYFERYPKVAAFMKSTRDKALKEKYVETIMGRRIPIIDGNKQAQARAAINAPMQGSAADIIKKAMLAVDSWLKEKQLTTKMILQVHDELVLESPQAEVDEVIENLPALMCGVVKLKAPLEVSVNRGANWDEAH